MKIVVSACLLGENCKYNGGNNFSEKLMRFSEGHEIIAVCPEVLGGLNTPRDPSEIVDGAVMTKTGRSVDTEFRRGAREALELVRLQGAALAILQSRSPSCGVKEIYDGSFSGRLIKGQGVFAHLLAEAGIDVIDIEDL